MVEIVERYLAEYRPILRDRACYTALMDIIRYLRPVGFRYFFFGVSGCHNSILLPSGS